MLGLIKRLEGQLVTCRAVAVRYSMAHLRGDQPHFDLTLLLRNVSCANVTVNESYHLVIAEHVWINVFDAPVFLRTLPKDEIQFDGELYIYTRNDGTKGWSFRRCSEVRTRTDDMDAMLADPRRWAISIRQHENLAKVAGEEWAGQVSPYLNRWTYRKLIRLFARWVKIPGNRAGIANHTKAQPPR